MDTVADLVAAGRERDGVAIDAPNRATPYSYGEFCTNTWKAGNLLGHYTHPGGRVAVMVGPKTGGVDRTGAVDAGDPVLATLGGTLVGATVDLSPDSPVDADALVRPAGAAWREAYPAAPGCSVLAYGGGSDTAAVEGFEAALWSENPVAPPERVDRGTPAVHTTAGTHSHGDLVDAAADVVDRHGLDGSSEVLLAGDLRERAVLVAGVLAPLSVGGTVLLDDPPDAVALVADGEREGRKD